MRRMNNYVYACVCGKKSDLKHNFLLKLDKFEKK